MNAKTQDTRQHILDVGYELIVNKGFTAVGLAQLLKSAEVPKGSFYHYFKSKEQFGEALIEEYVRSYMDRIQRVLNQPEMNGRDCLLDYFSRWLAIDNGVCNANKCLIVKLSAEVSDLSDTMRVSLAKGAELIIRALEDTLKRGITDGSIVQLDCHLVASQLYQQWLGASLLNKLIQDQSHLELCLETTKQRLITE
ncbi:TetR/AcrR family transcriptional regulator [Vibrio aquaticus]|uniref:TetR/AcrR family transcriptional regulator n=1 Tax=Vibrio aquaticus TaxID=2496559 RepID=A0A432D0M5_9VIBR|nr:TetR/AcrR family transcriptional regulator [Vibrio aquaticus]RTZ17493.1 TetR/AcrR family transcriptional regulator [Vibrio aquaticus]